MSRVSIRPVHVHLVYGPEYRQWVQPDLIGATVEPFATAVERAGILQVEDYFPGCIIAVADLVEVVQITPDNLPPEPERSFGNYEPGRYAWHLQNVRGLRLVVPVQGALGLWTLDPDKAAIVELQLLDLRQQAKTPNPGSDEAIKAGCTCPILDNGHGRGSAEYGGFVIVQGCPLHDIKGDLSGEWLDAKGRAL